MDDPRKWVQVLSDVRDRMNSGELNPGDRVPTKNLLRTHQTAPQTVAKALKVLVAEGQLRLMAGYGYVVTAQIGSPDDVWGNIRSSDIRKWVQLKTRLAKEIELGILEPGDEVVVALEAKDFGIASETAAKAFHELVAEGKLLPPLPGKPYTVPR